MNDHDPVNTGPEGRGAWSEEDLLEWILDERARAATERAELTRDAATAAELRGLEDFVADCRASLADERVAHAGRELTGEILARTTREDLGLRGDLRLVGGFVRQSLRNSVLLRVVAASLLLHVAALPVLAYFSFFRPRAPETRITFEGPRGLEALPYAAADEEPEPVVVGPELETDPAALPAAGELFAARLAAQGLANLENRSAVPYEQVVWGDELGLVLWTEHQLDRAATAQPGAARLLRFALENLSHTLSEAGGSQAPGQAPAAALRRLAESAWLRAERQDRTADLAPEFALDPSRLEYARELHGDAWAEVYLEAVRGEF